VADCPGTGAAPSHATWRPGGAKADGGSDLSAFMDAPHAPYPLLRRTVTEDKWAEERERAGLPLVAGPKFLSSRPARTRPERVAPLAGHLDYNTTISSIYSARWCSQISKGQRDDIVHPFIVVIYSIIANNTVYITSMFRCWCSRIS